jgi:hypothetical protein
MGLRLNIIIIAEGAIDIDGKAITASMVINQSNIMKLPTSLTMEAVIAFPSISIAPSAIIIIFSRNPISLSCYII